MYYIKLCHRKCITDHHRHRIPETEHYCDVAVIYSSFFSLMHLIVWGMIMK